VLNIHVPPTPFASCGILINIDIQAIIGDQACLKLGVERLRNRFIPAVGESYFLVIFMNVILPLVQ
jgi:hypothetical protein